MIGQTVSHYRIIEKLGEGGMGVVYAAEDARLHRRVAVKFLASSSNVHHRSRFLREARAVSALSHPHIAAIYDYGETSDGQPYIVMELVAGQTLSELIAEGALTLARAVEIVEEVAEALAEAHRLGIVHRDIKPSNVILDGRGAAKVLDFGLAKQLTEATDKGLTDPEALTLFAATRTQSGLVVGTPLYLSPEQAIGADVDARSDVFALGSLLYECVAGRPAFSGASVIEIGAQVIHVNPPPPSSFNPRVPKQLDRIALKALAKKPEARYQSAVEMLADLRAARATLNGHSQHRTPRLRDLSGAHLRTSALMTLSENLRRPRLSLASFMITLFIAAACVWGAVRLWRPSVHRANAEAQRWYDAGADALREGAYYQASKSLEQAVKADDEFALAHAALAEAWSELDYSERAKDELLRVAGLVPDRSVLPQLDARYLDAISSTVTRDYTRAVDSYREIARLVPDKAQSYVDLGRAYEKNEDVKKAIDSYVEATNRNPQYATAYLRVGYLYGRQQDLASTTAAFDKAATLYQAFGNIEGQTEVHYQRGFLFTNLGKAADSRRELESALEMARATGNIYQQAKILLKLSDVAMDTGDTAQAQVFTRQGIELAQANGIDYLTERGLVDLGNVFLTSGDYDQADKLFKQSLALAEQHKGTRNIARARLSLGSLRTAQGNPVEAVSYIEQALPFYQQGGYRKETSTALTLLARANKQKGNYDAALQIYQQQLQAAEQTGDQSQIALAHQEIGTLLVRQEHYTEAIPHFDECYALYKSLGMQQSIANSVMNRAEALWQVGRDKEARASLDQAFAIVKEHVASDNRQAASFYLYEARMALTQRGFPEAQATGRQALELAGGKYKEIAIRGKFTLGLAQTFSGIKDKGNALCEEAANMVQQQQAGAIDPWLLSQALLAFAETSLENDDVAAAQTNASRAAEMFAQLGALDSEWRALLIAGRAELRAGNREASRQRFTNAADTLSQFQQRLGADAYPSYLARPDIALYHKQLGEALAGEK